MKTLLSLLLLCTATFAAEPAWKLSGRYNFVFEGDSLTASPGWSTPFLAFPGMSVHTGQSANVATGGDFATNLINQYAAQVFPLRPNGPTNAWLFVMAGVNDIGSVSAPIYPASVIFKALTNYVAVAQADGFKVSIATLPDRDYWHTIPALGAARDELNGYITNHSHLFDFTYRADQTFTNANDTLIFNDGTHFTTLGKDIYGGQQATNFLPVFIRPPATFSRLEVGTLTIGR